MNRNLTENQKDVCINAYLMSLAVFITTLPIPILNLIANLFYYISYRKNNYIIRWHTFNSFLSQIPLFFINSYVWYLVWEIIWGEIEISNLIISYFVIAFILNVGEIISSIICCIKVKQMKDVNIPLISPLSHIFCKKISWDKWEKTWEKADDIFFEYAKKAKGKLIKDTILILGLFIAIICCINIYNPKEKWNTPKVSLENYLSEYMYENTIENSLHENQDVQKRIQKIADLICTKNGLDSIKTYVVNKNEVNAFAYPGRNIAVYTKLISTCEKESELAAVMAHEIAHVEKKHVITSLKKNIGFSIIASVLFGDISQIITKITSNRLSQSCEIEADYFAIEYTHNAQYDPNGFISFMKIIDDESIDLPLNSILSTHPKTKDRISNAEKQIIAFETINNQTLLSENEWKQLKNKVDSEKASNK